MTAGSGKDYNEKADLYSLGLFLFLSPYKKILILLLRDGYV
jgi:hypothetical protein